MIENENTEETNIELTDNSYAINTSTIFWKEFQIRNEPEYFNKKKCPLEIASDLEHTIQELLVMHVEPTVDYSDHMKEYLMERFEKFNTANMSVEPFRINFFVTAYDRPRNKDGNNGLVFSGDNYFYLYDYHETFVATKKAIRDDQFELLFAFALRQCDLMHIDAFLLYHLLANFNGGRKEYCKYLTQINRKFSTALFIPDLSDSIRDWILENENFIDTNLPKRIKTYLTVDQLAFLFRALVDNSHLSDENKNTIIQWACKSFESKKQPEISEKSFNQKFYAPTEEALDFWAENFDKLSKIAIRMKQKKEP